MDYSAYLSSNYLNTAVNTSVSVDDAALGVLFGAFAGAALVMAFVGFVVGILTIIANWKIFTKAGEKGWKTLIPIYNLVTLFKIVGINPLWVLGYLVSIIPIVGPILALVLTIYVMYKLALAFGKDGAFTVGLVLLNTIFILILGFGKAEYQLPKETTATE